MHAPSCVISFSDSIREATFGVGPRISLCDRMSYIIARLDSVLMTASVAPVDTHNR